MLCSNRRDVPGGRRRRRTRTHGRNAQRSLGERLGEHLVHLGGNLIGSLVGQLGRDGVLLLVRVVDYLRMLDVIGENVIMSRLNDSG